MVHFRGILCSAVIAFSLFSLPAFAGISTQICREQALNDARKLLIFYNGRTNVYIENKVTPLATLTNPANNTQHFDVLEVWGDVYKGKYRMRLIYFSQLHCLRMGEEILEYANL